MRIGIDLGGTKIEILALDDAASVSFQRRVATPPGSYDATVRAVTELVAAAEAELGARASVGVAIPGALSAATGMVKNANSTWLNGRPFDRDLGRALARPIRLANDANCLALSEAQDGAGKGARVVFGVILGTGVGGGIVVDGHLVTGPNAIAGEWGHNPLPWADDDERPGPECYCGKRGCIETFLSGPGLARDHLAHGGRELDAETLAARAADAAADPTPEKATLGRHARRMAKALAGVINILDPDIIVVGGGLSNIASLYTAVPALWRDYVFSDRVDTRLKPARHGDSSGVRGAARLWPLDGAGDSGHG